jgi:hypothetical protein
MALSIRCWLKHSNHSSVASTVASWFSKAYGGGNSALQSPLIVLPIALSQLQPRCLKGTTLVRRKNYAKCQ